ncbi:hypothetical protein NDU88_002324 [Pleurodeles waltl]|uniref:Uncharacterized protein n=1 Tax=Pleurodeles waltl TaxID=8319 RepID=A0AAV7P9C0_PLEWA|nr:hypothetical protein NDU88_002324 [Pleurodeles waltl]
MAEAGNPDARISGTIPVRGRRLERVEEGEDTGAGNPDIRVPESLKTKVGLRAERAEKEKDAEGRRAGNTRKEDIREDEQTIDAYIAGKRPSNGRDNTLGGQEGPNKPEVRHVPGGTWLKQVRS